VSAMTDLPDAETLLEVGLVVLAGLLAGGAFVLAGGRAAGDAGHRRRRRERPPLAGSVPAERHQHVGAVAPR